MNDTQVKKIIKKNPDNFYYVRWISSDGKEQMAVRPKRVWKKTAKVGYHKKKGTTNEEMLMSLMDDVAVFNELFGNKDQLIITFTKNL